MAIYHHISLVPTPSGVMPAYTASPEGSGPHPAILVIQGMGGPGITEFLAAERLAGELEQDAFKLGLGFGLGIAFHGQRA